jgi:hypothetical protein
MSWSSPVVQSVARFSARALLVAAALTAGAQLFVGGCGKEPPTAATPPSASRSSADSQTAPAEGVHGYATGEVGLSWTMNGVTVTIVGDDWGPGTCHAPEVGRQCRKYRIENGSTTAIYSRLAIFNGPAPGCGPVGPDAPTGDPHMFEGPDVIAPGGKETVGYCVDVSAEKCNRIHVMDSWGPLGVFVVGDVFNFSKACAPPPTFAPTATLGPTVFPTATLGPTVFPTATLGPTATPGPTVVPTLTPAPTPFVTLTPTPIPPTPTP